jgi:hypothetical protein
MVCTPRPQSLRLDNDERRRRYQRTSRRRRALASRRREWVPDADFAFANTLRPLLETTLDELEDRQNSKAVYRFRTPGPRR